MKISVCLASYNGSKYISTQIESILSQLDLYDEIIISDDNSTDNTLEIVKKFNDKRIKIFNNSFGNPIKNFEFTLKMATGDIIFLSDQDDLWLPDKVKKMINCLVDKDIVVSNCYIGDEKLNIIRDSYFEWRNSKKGFLKNLWRNSYLGCCMCFKRKILDRVLPFPKDIPMHDMWIGAVAEAYYNPVFLEEKLMIYRRHNNNATFLNEDFTSNETFLRRVKFRTTLLSAIILRLLKIR